jgi:hypothetical protein
MYGKTKHSKSPINSQFRYIEICLFMAVGIHTSALKDFLIIWLSNRYVPGEDYSRNVSWAVNKISTFLLKIQ